MKTWRFDFGPAGRSRPGYVRAAADTAYTVERGYGFLGLGKDSYLEDGGVTVSAWWKGRTFCRISRDEMPRQMRSVLRTLACRSGLPKVDPKRITG